MLKNALLIILLCCGGLAFSQNTRYLNRVFSQVSKSADIVYGNAPGISFPYISEAITTNVSLTMDIFQPTGDTASARPLIVFIHSGAFLTGSKDNEDMQALCDSFAHRGYVTTSINYRQNFNVLSSTSAERAVYRGLQDAAAAIRFMKEFRTTYKIDTAHIFALGSSAGGFSALNLAYLDNSERPASTFSGFLQPDLGCVDCAGNAYVHTHTLKAFASCWGAIGNTSWINASNNNVPAILFHGDQDGTVPYDQGHPFGYPIFPIVYGSLPVNNRLSSQGILHEFYTGVGEDHEYWGTCNGAWCPAPTNFYSDILNKTALFFYNQLPSTPVPLEWLDFQANKQGKSAFLSWSSAQERNMCCYELERSSDGLSFQSLARIPAAGNSNIIQRYAFADKDPALGRNYYRLKQLDEDGRFSWSPIVELFFDGASFRVYPNPGSGIFHIQTEDTIASGRISVCNALGQLLFEGPLTDEALDLSVLAEGVYWIRLETEGGVENRQLVLKRD